MLGHRWVKPGTFSGVALGTGEQTRLTYVMAVPAEDLEVQGRKFWQKAFELCFSGQGGLSIACAVGFTGLIIVALSCVPEGKWF